MAREFLSKTHEIDKEKYPSYLTDDKGAIRKIDLEAVEEVLSKVDISALSREIKDFIIRNLDQKYYNNDTNYLNSLTERFSERNVLVIAVLVEKLKRDLSRVKLVVSDEASSRSLALLMWQLAKKSQKDDTNRPQFRAIVGGDLRKMMTSGDSETLEEFNQREKIFTIKYWNSLYQKVKDLAVGHNEPVLLVNEFSHHKKSIKRLHRAFRRSGYQDITVATMSSFYDIDPTKSKHSAFEEDQVFGCVGLAGEDAYFLFSEESHGVTKKYDLEEPDLVSQRVELPNEIYVIPPQPNKKNFVTVERMVIKILADGLKVLLES